MKVRIFRSVDVEAEVDVDLDDVMGEFWDRVQEAELLPKRSLSIVDGATRMLQRVPDEVLAEASSEAVAEVVKRLTAELARWEQVAR